ncbi:hypothetical protein PPYR_09309, partial [Photinus pyralis]
FCDTLEDTFSLMVPACEDLICVGDFNINLLDESAQSLKFLDLLNTYGCMQ